MARAEKSVEDSDAKSVIYPWIASDLQERAFPVDQLVEDPDNVRTHNDRNIAVIKASLEEFSQDQPLVVRRSDRVVIKGNGRLRAAKELGWSHVAVVWVNDTQADSMRRSLADNRSGELATWEHMALGRYLQSEKTAGRKVDSIGFSDEEVAFLVCGYQRREKAPEPDVHTTQSGADSSGSSDSPKPPQEEYVISIAGVRWTDRDSLVASIKDLLEEDGLPYQVKSH